MEARDSLPSRDDFFDTLANSIVVTEADYELAQQIWHQCRCQSLKDYMMLYLKIDVHLLADIFETFRYTVMQEDKLDPANFLSIPGLSWAAALRSMPHAIELLPNLDMYEFFEAGLRGGMTFVNKHYAKKTESTNLLYVDVNNLYGSSLSKKLPYKNFKLITDDVVLSTICDNLPDEYADVGYYLDVNLHIPEACHNRLADLPPAPLTEKPPGSNVNKLLLTLNDKKNYCVHSALLKFYIEVMGVVVTKVNKAIQFSQTEIFKRYIDDNTTKRAQATSKFQKDYYKLKNNSLYGKTVENLRKRKDVRLCNRRDVFVKYVSKPLFKRAIQIDANLTAAVLTKEHICLNRPVFVGQAVLDLSKLLMYQLQYVKLQRYRELYPNCSIKILAGDTDSYFLEVENINLTEQLLPQMKADGLLDRSNYPISSALYSNCNENKLGLIKDESCGIEDYVEWVFLRPKCYSLLSRTKESHKAKGVTKATRLNHIQYLRIYNTYNPKEPHASLSVQVQQRSIISKNHQLYTILYNKQALSIMDNKRVWLKPNESLPYGHFALCFDDALT